MLAFVQTNTSGLFSRKCKHNILITHLRGNREIDIYIQDIFNNILNLHNTKSSASPK